MSKALGNPSKGYNAPDKKKRGIMKKLRIIGNACMSSMCDAIAEPKAVKKNPIKNKKSKATGNIIKLVGLKPAIKHTAKTNNP